MLRWAPASLNFFQGGGGGLFNPRGPLDQISILKIIIFLTIFLSFFGIFILYDVASLNDTNKQLYDRVRNVYIIYDHSISDGPKHISAFSPPLVNTTTLNPLL